MARLVLAATMLALTAHTTYAADPEVEQLAGEVGIPVDQLMGALNSQPGVDARQYLVFDGLLEPPKPALNGLLSCIAWHESRNDPNATNRSSKAAGLFQFLWSTWAGTPQGRLGLSPYDPVAATAAAEWMVSQGRVREWVAVSGGFC